MLKALLLSLTLTLAGMAMAQNLVPNPSFEDTVNCDTPTQCTLLKATHWRNPTPSTPDVWDCDQQRACGYLMDTLDLGLIGVQPAFPGKRFAGYYLWDGPDAPVREYAMVRLQFPLISGQHYLVSLKYSRADGCMYAVDHIAVWLGVDSISSSFPFRLELNPQVRLRSSENSHLLEKDEWETISDTMVATGGEQWMVIGLFEADEIVDAVVANSESIAPSAYYFIDDVSIHQIEVVGSAVVDYAAWWDGTFINVSGWGDDFHSELTLWDMSGRVLQREIIWGKEIPISSQLSAGVYLVELRVQGTIKRFKFLKEDGGL